MKIEAISKIGSWFPAKNAGSSSRQGGLKFQPAGILKYFEDLKREPNTGFGPKDIYEIGSN